MTWNDLKKKLNKLGEKELKTEAIFITDCRTQSGIIKKAKKVSARLYNTFEDDPNQLKTKKQLKEDGLDNEDIEDCAIEFNKGQFFIEIKFD